MLMIAAGWPPHRRESCPGPIVERLRRQDLEAAGCRIVAIPEMLN
jgi:hypothetical protein